MPTVAANYALIKSRLEAACLRAGRDPGGITVLAVTKFHQADRIREAAAAGLKAFGESRQQEALAKLPPLKGLGEWHFIGNLQTNKAKSVAELFDVVQSVDSLRLAEKLSAAALELGKTLRIYAQVNISQEPQKHGYALEGAESEILALASLPGLKLEGLMGMAAATENPKDARPSFAALRALGERLKGGGVGLKLSMGMSDDFEIAIEEGADLVRIGTALFYK
jgi:pyridoxal phosphate enzyme (YggS family)